MTEKRCHTAWRELSDILHLSKSLSNKWWGVLQAYFKEEQRHYHTFEHLTELLQFTQNYKHLITNYPVILLAIFFHDIVYNPQSGFNEEDSNDIFLQFVIDCNSKDVSQYATKVFAIIKMTKSHKLPPDADFDMKFFSDIDMAILGSPSERYHKYAAQIRLEFSFVEFNTFCIKRSVFLQSCLSSDQPMFSTEMIQTACGQRARDNIAWEHGLLNAFQCPVKSWEAENGGVSALTNGLRLEGNECCSWSGICKCVGEHGLLIQALVTAWLVAQSN
mmetsp:Transcript_15680/g.26139  ORF Transcript_15680/g.26139 Transcript_15680/m.26139 type:complete len:275 (-) Transcript_15680:197-1021(-)